MKNSKPEPLIWIRENPTDAESPYVPVCPTCLQEVKETVRVCPYCGKHISLDRGRE